jgi:hypothetical protein
MDCTVSEENIKKNAFIPPLLTAHFGFVVLAHQGRGENAACIFALFSLHFGFGQKMYFFLHFLAFFFNLDATLTKEKVNHRVGICIFKVFIFMPPKAPDALS